MRTIPVEETEMMYAFADYIEELQFGQRSDGDQNNLGRACKLEVADYLREITIKQAMKSPLID